MSNYQGFIKPYSSRFGFLSRSVDSLLIVLALKLIGWFYQVTLPSEVWVAGLLAGLLFQILAEFTDIYRSWRAESLWAETRQVVLCWGLCFVTMFCFGQLSSLEQTLFSWPRAAQWFASVAGLMLVWRMSVRMLLRELRARGYNTRKVAIVGSSKLATEVASRMKAADWAGYKIHGFFDYSPQQANDQFRQLCARTDVERQTVGSIDELVEIACGGQVDSIYIALPLREEQRIQEILSRLSNSTATVNVVPDLFVFELLHARTFNLNGLPVFSLVGEPMRGMSGWGKRVEDIILAALILTLIAPLLLVVAAMIKLTSRGPALFKQQRYGLDGKPIKVWKFRTMTVMENGSDFKQATKGDNRITPVGAFLRKTSLDELPQFFNVLQGSMSIVGPRPHAVAHNEEFRGQVKNYMRRHKIKPGITGWAQINGWRGETDTLEKMEKRVEYDLHYIQNWSVWWDLKIIAKTVFKGFIGKNVY